MKGIKKISVFIILFELIGLFIFKISAQELNSCSQNLLTAQTKYDQGMLDTIPLLLQPCLSNGLSNQEALAAYKLLILSYIFDDNQIKAEETMLAFLKSFPEYQLIADDPVEFGFLFDSYETISLFSIGFGVGSTLTQQFVQERFSSGDLNTLNRKYRNTAPGYSLGLGVSRNFTKSIGLNLEFIYSNKQYGYSETQTGAWTSNFDMSQNSFEIPLSMTYDFSEMGRKGKIKPYARVGFGISSVLSEKMKSSLIFENGQSLIPEKQFDLSGYVSPINYFLTGGGGVKYTMVSGNLYIDFRYGFNLNNNMSGSFEEKNNELYYNYLFNPNKYKLGTFSLRIGYTYSIFEPKKKK